MLTFFKTKICLTPAKLLLVLALFITACADVSQEDEDIRLPRLNIRQYDTKTDQELNNKAAIRWDSYNTVVCHDGGSSESRAWEKKFPLNLRRGNTKGLAELDLSIEKSQGNSGNFLVSLECWGEDKSVGSVVATHEVQVYATTQFREDFDVTKIVEGGVDKVVISWAFDAVEDFDCEASTSYKVDGKDLVSNIWSGSKTRSGVEKHTIFNYDYSFVLSCSINGSENKYEASLNNSSTSSGTSLALDSVNSNSSPITVYLNAMTVEEFSFTTLQAIPLADGLGLTVPISHHPETCTYTAQIPYTGKTHKLQLENEDTAQLIYQGDLTQDVFMDGWATGKCKI
ncbi:MAG: hypothetical protein OEZ47_13240 [Gammaproteobacteria bacterium]|nr:hypothetical protein [Gammaproteobacteria bacterium]